jgi:uncharacterized protein YraI
MAKPMHAQVLRVVLALVLATGLLAPVMARAQDSGGIEVDSIVLIDTDGVNMRDTPGTDGDIVTDLNAGIQLEIIDGPETADGYTWWMGVVLNEDSVDQGISGWVAEDFLTVDDVETPPDDGEEQTPTPTPNDSDPTPTPTPDVDDDGDLTFENAGWIVVRDGPVNIRENPGTSADIIRTLAEGETATVVEDASLTELNGYTWINVTTLDDETGWLATDFLDPLSEDPCTDDACEPTDDGEGGLLDAEAVHVFDGDLNVRGAASLNGTVLGVVPTGTILETSSPGDMQSSGGFDWLKVVFEGGIGWVATDFIETSDEACDDSPCLPSDTGTDSDPGDPFADALGVSVFDGPLNVRDQPAISGEILTVLETGAEVPVDTRSELTDADGYTWIRIVFNGGNGWVATDFVEPMDELPCLDGACYPAELNPFFLADGAFVVDGPLNLRANPDTGADILMVLEEGDYLWIQSVIGPDPHEANGYLWIEVSVAGTRGFVAIDFIEPAT